MPQRGESSQALLGNGAKKAVSLRLVKNCGMNCWMFGRGRKHRVEGRKPKIEARRRKVKAERRTCLQHKKRISLLARFNPHTTLSHPSTRIPDSIVLLGDREDRATSHPIQSSLRFLFHHHQHSIIHPTLHHFTRASFHSTSPCRTWHILLHTLAPPLLPLPSQIPVHRRDQGVRAGYWIFHRVGQGGHYRGSDRLCLGIWYLSSFTSFVSIPARCHLSPVFTDCRLSLLCHYDSIDTLGLR
jgi:hypothetical protein